MLLAGWQQSPHLDSCTFSPIHALGRPHPPSPSVNTETQVLRRTLCTLVPQPLPHPHSIPCPVLVPPNVPSPNPAVQPQTSTSCGPGVAAGLVMLMSKQVTIMTWALHRFTHCSRAAVARSKATRYSADSGSSSGSTSTVEGQETAGQARSAGPRKCFHALPASRPPSG